MSKAQRIRDLYAQRKTCGEIAKIIGCRVEYARVCAQQRGTKAIDGRSKAEWAYIKKRYGTDDWAEGLRLAARARYADPVRHAQHLQNCRNYRARKSAANHASR